MDVVFHGVCHRWDVAYQNVDVILSRHSRRYLNFPLIVERGIILEDEVSLRRLTQLLLFVDLLSRLLVYQVELSVVFLSIFYLCDILLLP